MTFKIYPLALYLAAAFWLGLGVVQASASEAPSVLTRELSACIRSPVDVYCTEHFRVLHTPDADWAPEVGVWLEHLLTRFVAVSQRNGFAPRPPAAPMTWVCLSDAAAYEMYNSKFENGCPHDRKSYYSSRTRCVVLLHREDSIAPVEPPVDGSVRSDIRKSARIAHEAVHQLSYNTGIQTRGVMYPLWVSEGLATFYEGALLSSDDASDDNSGRRERLVSAYRSGRLISLDKFIAMTQVPSEANARDDFYAECWGLMSFLVGKEGRGLREYLGLLTVLRAGLRSSAALRREFAQVFGDPVELEPRWRTYVESLGNHDKMAGNAIASPTLAMSRP